MSSGTFSGIEAAQFFTRYPFIVPGKYLLQIDKVKMITTRNKGDAFLIEALVLESTDPVRAPGTHVTQMFMRSKDSFLSNVKQFAFAVLSRPMEDWDGLSSPAQITGEMVDMLVGEDNPACGIILRVEASEGETKDKRPFTRVNWFAGDDTDWKKYGPKPDVATVPISKSA